MSLPTDLENIIHGYVHQINKSNLHDELLRSRKLIIRDRSDTRFIMNENIDPNDDELNDLEIYNHSFIWEYVSLDRNHNIIKKVFYTHNQSIDNESFYASTITNNNNNTGIFRTIHSINSNIIENKYNHVFIGNPWNLFDRNISDWVCG